MLTNEQLIYRMVFPPACAECGRIFDLTNAVDADEYSYGHDCEGV